jgi:hypothetical protein
VSDLARALRFAPCHLAAFVILQHLQKFPAIERGAIAAKRGNAKRKPLPWQTSDTR